MTVIRHAQVLFSQGILGPYLDARSDSPIYSAGTKSLTNFLVLPQGGIMRRPGFEFVDTISIPSGGTTADIRLLPFTFNNEQSYVLVFTENQIAIYKDKIFLVRVTTSYLGADLKSLRFAQSGDTLIIVHPDYAPAELKRNGSNTDWTISDIDFTTLPYNRFNPTISLTPSGTTGTINLTTSEAYWTSDHVGEKVNINGGLATVDSITSTTVASCTVTETLTGTTASKAWEEEAWNDAHGYPRSVVFYQNRLYFGGTRDAPATIFASKTGDQYNFDDGVIADTITDDMAFSFTLSTDQEHVMLDMRAQKNLQLFTSEGEFAITGGTEGITPSNIQSLPQSNYGSTNVPTLQVDDEVLFFTRNNKEARSFAYDLSTDKYISKNYTTVANNILDEINYPVATAYLSSYKDTQANYIFVPRADGKMPVLSLDVRKEVLGWSLFETDGDFLDAVVVSTDHGSGFPVDTLYVATFRRIEASDSTVDSTVNSNPGVFLECLTEDEAYLDHWYVGNSATAKKDWGGVSTLAFGETVGVIADGLVHEDVTVDFDGDFSLNFPATQVVVGLHYTSQVETMKFDIDLNGTLTRGNRQRKVRAFVNLYETKSLNIDGYDVSFRFFGNDLLDDPLVAFTGTKQIRLGGTGTELSSILKVTEPLPATILSFTVEIAVSL